MQHVLKCVRRVPSPCLVYHPSIQRAPVQSRTHIHAHTRTHELACPGLQIKIPSIASIVKTLIQRVTSSTITCLLSFAFDWMFCYEKYVCVALRELTFDCLVAATVHHNRRPQDIIIIARWCCFCFCRLKTRPRVTLNCVWQQSIAHRSDRQPATVWHSWKQWQMFVKSHNSQKFRMLPSYSIATL